MGFELVGLEGAAKGYVGSGKSMLSSIIRFVLVRRLYITSAVSNVQTVDSLLSGRNITGLGIAVKPAISNREARWSKTALGVQGWYIKDYPEASAL